MAADQAAVVTGTLTLTADTSQTIQLTGPGRRIELIHHGNDTTVVYYKLASTEAAADTMTGGGADEERALLSGERLLVNVPRALDGSGDIWIGLRSAGTPTVSAEIVIGGK